MSFSAGLTIAVFRSRGKRCVDVRDGRQENVKVFTKKRGGNEIAITSFSGALLIIFKTNSSATGSKVSEGFSAKEISVQGAGLEEEKKF